MEYQVDQEVSFKDRNFTVAAVNRGWLTLRDADGDIEKARPKDVEPISERVMKRQLARARKRYQRTESYGGDVSYDNGDEVAELLRGLEPKDVCSLADVVLDTDSGFHFRRYGHLNPGQQRMNAGNRIRFALTKKIEKQQLLLSELNSRGHESWKR